MKLSPIASSSLIFFICYLLHISVPLAALSILSPHNATLSATSDSTLVSPQDPNEYLPDPFSFPVRDTPTTLVFGKYVYPNPPFNKYFVTAIVERALYDVVRGLITARGDAPIAQPTFDWNRYKISIKVQQRSVGTLSWSTLADVLQGIVDFASRNDYYVGCEFTVLTAEDGIVATGSVGKG